jgi:hypothetical protein|tara:strand:- start:32 stop:700 length:669 start_codon:yes stop_codon:yes gene_type:complete
MDVSDELTFIEERSAKLREIIVSTLFLPDTINKLSKLDTEGEIVTILDANELFGKSDTLNKIYIGILVNDRSEGEIKAFYSCIPDNRAGSNMAITINIPRNYSNIENFKEWVEPELEDALSHELQHSCDSTEMLSADIPEEEAKWENLESIYRHFASEAETRGHLSGARGRSRMSGEDVDKVLMNMISSIYDEAIDRGFDLNDAASIAQRIWKKWSEYEVTF